MLRFSLTGTKETEIEHSKIPNDGLDKLADAETMRKIVEKMKNSANESSMCSDSESITSELNRALSANNSVGITK